MTPKPNIRFLEANLPDRAPILSLHLPPRHPLGLSLRVLSGGAAAPSWTGSSVILSPPMPVPQANSPIRPEAPAKKKNPVIRV
jgi:hypothetical protein